MIRLRHLLTLLMGFMVAVGARGEISLDLLTNLVSEDATVQQSAVTALVQLHDPEADALLQAVTDRKIYVWNTADAKQFVVIAGDETDEPALSGVEGNGATVRPIEKAYGAESVTATTAPSAELTEAGFTRQLRKHLREIIRLGSSDHQERRAAANHFAQAADSDLLPLLESSEQAETDSATRAAIHEAILLTKLLDPTPETRAEAAKELGRLHAPNALIVFQERLKEGGEEDETVRASIRDGIQQIQRLQLVGKVLGTLWNGLSLASVLVIIALGLTVTFGLMKVINMAHGELMLAGAYATYVLHKVIPPPLFGAYPILALPVAFVISALLGLLIEVLVVRRFYGRPLDTLLATFGISLIVQQAVRHIFGAANVDVSSPAWLNGGVPVFADLVLPYNRLFILAVSLAALGVTTFVLIRTSVGLKIRAVTQNRDMSAALGIATRRIDRGTFAFGSGLAGVAGCALSQLGNVGPDLGQTYIVDAFMVVVLGGVGKLLGVIAGAGLIGGGNKLLETLTTSPVVGKVLILIGLILFLQRYPSGIFPDRGRHQES